MKQNFISLLWCSIHWSGKAGKQSSLSSSSHTRPLACFFSGLPLNISIFQFHPSHPFSRSVDVLPPFLGLFVPFCLPFLPASGLLGDQSSWRTLIRGNRTAMFTLIYVPAKRKLQFNIAVSTLVEQMQGNEMQGEQEVTTCWQKVRAQWVCSSKQTSLMQRDYSLCRECETRNTWFWI